MDNLNARLLALLTIPALLLAGCATDTGGNDDNGGGTPPPTPSTAQAEDMLQQAAAGMPDKFGARIAITRGSQSLMTMNGTFDNATGTSYLEMRGDPAALQALGGDEADMGMGGFGETIANGITLYSGPEGALYIINGTALVFPPDNETDDGGSPSPIPRPEDSPLGGFFDPEDGLGALGAANVTVSDVRPTTFRGRAAVQMTVSGMGMDEADNGTATVTVFTNPVRIARVEGDAPSTGDNPADPFAGARYSAEFFYEGEAGMEVPENVRRAVGLSYESDANPFMQSEGPTTWTFLASGGIPLAEVEVQVKNASEGDADPSDFSSVGQLPTAWTLRLSDKTRTQDGVTLTFTDADNDGKVSKGDTLQIQAPEGEMPPTVVLYDTKTGTYVVPGPAMLLGLAALGLAAMLLRRRD